MNKDASQTLPSPGTDALSRLREQCTQCGLCVKECAFLARHGTPLDIADRYANGQGPCPQMPFECSLCGLCTAVCPQSLPLDQMFLEMRRAAVSRGCRVFGNDCVFLGYEQRGVSRHLSFYALPTGCDTVFFPGCSLPATRPGLTYRLLRHLQRFTPRLGVVLDCCTKPSHDLGRQGYFEAMFGEMRAFLLSCGVRRVIVACPNCHKIFSSYGKGLSVTTVYEVLAGSGRPTYRRPHRGHVTVHDPCVFRFETGIQDLVRDILREMGWEVSEMPHHGQTTLCCGEGASVSCVAPDLAHTWTRLRSAEAGRQRVVTYCTGCSELLSGRVDAVHLLDLVFGRVAGPRAQRLRSLFPLTCVNRLRLKERLRQEFSGARLRERTFASDAGERKCGLTRNRLSLLVSLAISKLFALRC